MNTYCGTGLANPRNPRELTLAWDHNVYARKLKRRVALASDLSKKGHDLRKKHSYSASSSHRPRNIQVCEMVPRTESIHMIPFLLRNRIEYDIFCIKLITEKT